MLIERGTQLTFCWIPSHYSFYNNEKADRAAKHGAKHGFDTEYLGFPLSLHEQFNLLTSHIWKTFQSGMIQYDRQELFYIKRIKHDFSVNRPLLSLMYRWKLDSFKTNYVQNVVYVCGSKTIPYHILSCEDMKKCIPVLFQNESYYF